MNVTKMYRLLEGRNGKFFVMADGESAPVADCHYDETAAKQIVQALNSHMTMITALRMMIELPDHPGSVLNAREALAKAQQRS